MGRCVAIALGLLVLPLLAKAASFDCVRAGDAVEKTICASPVVSRLDSRLSAVYATVLARDPTRADALRRDERNWLAERDDQAWQLLSDSETTAHASKGLEGMYRERIQFLQSLDDPADERGSPIVEKVLAALRHLPPDTADVFDALKARRLIVLSAKRSFTNVKDAIAALPAPPDAPLRKALQQYADQAGFTLEYVPSAGLGGVFNIEGTAECMYWVLFAKRGAVTTFVKTSGQTLDGCWNAVGRLALMDGDPVALLDTRGIAAQDESLQWRRWLDGEWGAAARVLVRFDRKLEINVASCDPSVGCDEVRKLAMSIAKRYDAKPLPSTLANAVALSPTERESYRRMESFAENADAVSVLPQIGKH